MGVGVSGLLGRWGVAGLVLAGVVVVAVLLLVWGGSGQDPDGAEAPAAGSSVGVVEGSGLSAERARELEQGVNARDPQRLAEVLVVGDEHDPVEVAEQALPAGSELVVDEQTFTEVEGGGAFVEARIVGEQDFGVRLLLVEVEGRWMLAGSSEPEPTS